MPANVWRVSDTKVAGRGPAGPATFRDECLLALRLDVELDAHALADEEAARLQGLVPRQAPVLAVDLGAGREAEPLVAPRRGLGAVELHIEHDRPGHALDREVAGDDPGSALAG